MIYINEINWKTNIFRELMRAIATAFIDEFTYIDYIYFPYERGVE